MKWDLIPEAVVVESDEEDAKKSLDYSDIHIPRLGDSMAEEDDIFEEKDEEEEVEKSPDSDLVRGILDKVGDPKLKEMLSGWLSENDLEKEEDIVDEEGGGSDVIEEIAEEIAGEVEDIVEEVLGGGGSDEEPEMEKSEEDEDEDDLEKCDDDDLEKSDDEDEDVEKDDEDDEEEEEEPGVEKSWKVPLFKSEEERVVYGVVLEPGTKDLQGDIVRPADVRKACHEFMMKSQKVGHEHNGPAHASIIENYIAPLDFECGGQSVKKGSWIMVTKIHDLNLWEAVKSGDITGYSIGGTGVRTPV